MDLQLNHRKALVLGASRGIGAAIVQAFLNEGTQVHAVARRPEGLAALPASSQLCCHALDLTQPGAPPVKLQPP
jgi:NAD(P)-dependent dehydrogenase (short-subunit alcohol dehydrogenase family)